MVPFQVSVDSKGGGKKGKAAKWPINLLTYRAGARPFSRTSSSYYPVPIAQCVVISPPVFAC